MVYMGSVGIAGNDDNKMRNFLIKLKQKSF